MKLKLQWLRDILGLDDIYGKPYLDSTFTLREIEEACKDRYDFLNDDNKNIRIRLSKLEKAIKTKKINKTKTKTTTKRKSSAKK